MICGTRMLKRPPRRVPVTVLHRSVPLAQSALGLGGAALGGGVGSVIAAFVGAWWLPVVTGSMLGLGAMSLADWRPEGVSPSRALVRRGRRAVNAELELPDGSRALVYVGICGPLRQLARGELVRILPGHVEVPPERS